MNNDFPNPIYLTHPNIPKPLHGMNPRSIKGQEWWNEKRKIAYAAYHYRCWACGIHKSQAKYHQWLEAHEGYDINYETGRVELRKIIALCHSCHNFIHSGRLLILWEKGEFSTEKCEDIFKHGFDILKKAKLSPFLPTVEFADILGISYTGKIAYAEPRTIAPWDNWHLVIDGQKYYSKFKNINEWRKHYNR